MPVSNEQLKNYYEDNKEQFSIALRGLANSEEMVAKISHAYGLKANGEDNTISDTRTNRIPHGMNVRKIPFTVGMMVENSLFPNKTLDQLMSIDSPQDIADKQAAGAKLEEILGGDLQAFNRLFQDNARSMTNKLIAEFNKIDRFGPEMIRFAKKYEAILGGLQDCYNQKFAIKTTDRNGVSMDEVHPLAYDIQVLSSFTLNVDKYSSKMQELYSQVEAGQGIDLFSNLDNIAEIIGRKSAQNQHFNVVKNSLAFGSPKTIESANTVVNSEDTIFSQCIMNSNSGVGLLEKLEQDELLTLLAAPNGLFDFKCTGDADKKYFVNGIDLKIGQLMSPNDQPELNKLRGIINSYKEITRPAVPTTASQKAEMAYSRIVGTPLARRRENKSDQIYKLEKEGVQNKREPMGPVIMEDGAIQLNHIHQERGQSSTQGCWSVSLGLLMQSRGVTLEQEQIRAYIPGKDSSAKATDFTGEARKLLTEDTGNSPAERSDVVLRTLPNTAVRTKKFAIGAINPETVKYAASQIEDTVMNSLTQDKSPMSLLINGHVRTVVGLRDGVLIVKNSLPMNTVFPQSDVNEEVPISKLLSSPDPTGAINIELTWLKDIKTDENLNAHDIDPMFTHISYQNGNINANSAHNENAVLQKSGVNHTFTQMGGEGSVPEGMIIMDDIYVPKNVQKLPKNLPRIEDEVKEYHPKYETAKAAAERQIQPPPKRPNFFDKFINFITAGHGKTVQTWKTYQKELHMYHPDIEKVNKWIVKPTPLDANKVMKEVYGKSYQPQPKSLQNTAQKDMTAQKNVTAQKAHPATKKTAGERFAQSCSNIVGSNLAFDELAFNAVDSMNRLNDWAASGKQEMPPTTTQDLANIAVMNIFIHAGVTIDNNTNPVNIANALVNKPVFQEKVASLTPAKLRESLKDNCLRFSREALSKQPTVSDSAPAPTAMAQVKTSSTGGPSAGR